jgi:DME family drug/metabolite transporter
VFPVETARRSALTAYGAIAMAALIWGSLGLVAKFVYSQGMAPYQLAFWRSAVGALLGLAVLWISGSLPRGVTLRQFVGVLVMGLSGVTGFYTFYFLTLTRASVAVAAVLVYTAPVIAFLISWAFGKERPDRYKFAAMAGSLLGVALVSNLLQEGGSFPLTAMLTGLAAAASYAVFTVTAKEYRAQFQPLALVSFSLAVGTLALLPIAAVSGSLVPATTQAAWLVLILSAAAQALLAYALFTWGLKRVEASRAIVVATLEPVSAAMLGYVVLGEQMNAAQLVGATLVILSALAVQRFGSR